MTTNFLLQKDSWDLNGNGRLNLNEANAWRRKGGGDITINASSVDLDFVNPKDWNVGEQRRVQTLYKSMNGRVFGQLDIVYEGNNEFSIIKNEYDFNMHKVKNIKTFARNIFTKIGAIYAGRGADFMINFSGTNKVNYQPFQPNIPHEQKY